MQICVLCVCTRSEGGEKFSFGTGQVLARCTCLCRVSTLILYYLHSESPRLWAPTELLHLIQASAHMTLHLEYTLTTGNTVVWNTALVWSPRDVSSWSFLSCLSGTFSHLGVMHSVGALWKQLDMCFACGFNTSMLDIVLWPPPSAISACLSGEPITLRGAGAFCQLLFSVWSGEEVSWEQLLSEALIIAQWTSDRWLPQWSNYTIHHLLYPFWLV